MSFIFLNMPRLSPLLGFLLVLLGPAAALDCPPDASICPLVCRSYKKEVPRPTIYDACAAGCSARMEGKECKPVCDRMHLPKPTSKHACEAGCEGAAKEIQACEKHTSTDL